MNFSSNKVCKLLEDKKLLEILNTSGKSTVWQKFLYLNYIESKDCICHVICKTCKQALKHYKSTSGTTHLNDHLMFGKRRLSGPLRLSLLSTKSEGNINPTFN